MQIVKEQNWTQISDDSELRKLCTQVLEENKHAVAQYKAGKTKVFKGLLGCVATKSDQRADIAKCSTIMKELLEKL